MPPPRTGSVEPFKRADGTTYYRARIRLGDGTRARVDVPEKYSRPAGGRSGEERAELYALAAQEREDETGELLASKRKRSDPKRAETCDGWHERYLAYCKERGVTTTGDKGYRWGKWVSPRIGDKLIAIVSREEIEAIRNELDAAIVEGRLAWKTAANVWGELSVSFGEACSSKRPDLRVRNDDPTTGVQPPETGADKSKVYPYPSEFLAVMNASEDQVPRPWKELHAVAAYTFLRPGELYVLEWSEVDLEDEIIHVTRAWDYKGKKIKATKTWETREVPIHPNLLPLLKRMHKRAAGKGLVAPAISEANDDEMGEITRKHFELANCKRARLYARGSSQRRVQFRSWRDAGITWSIVEGVDVLKVQRRAGHKLIATTQRYIIEAENRGATFGTPFPTLPPSLLGEPRGPGGSGQGSGQVRRRIGKYPKVNSYPVRTEGVESSQTVESTGIPVDSSSDTAPRVDVSARNPVAFGPSKSTVEDALASAIVQASAAGRWDVVAQLARELEARRLATAGNVVKLRDDRDRK
jgi:integrase